MQKESQSIVNNREALKKKTVTAFSIRATFHLSNSENSS